MLGSAIQSFPVGITSSVVSGRSTVRSLSALDFASTPESALCAAGVADPNAISRTSAASLIRAKSNQSSVGGFSLKQVQDVSPRAISNHGYRARGIADPA